MRLKDTELFKEYNCYKVHHKRMNRYQVCLVPKIKNSSLNRKTITYAKYLLSIYNNELISSENEVDHIDGDKTNDCISNLQILSKSEHQAKTRKEFIDKWPKLICEQCKKLYSRPKRNVKKNTKYCSRGCLYDSMRK